MQDLVRSLLRLAIAVGIASVVTSANAAEVPVDQKDLKFVPDVVTIKAGDSVRFTDTDRIAHNVTIVNADGSSEDKGWPNTISTSW